MNNPHLSARLPVYSREQIVARIGAGQSGAEVATAFGVLVLTVHKCVARFKAGGLAALANRARAPRRRSSRLPDDIVAVIVWLWRRLRMTAHETPWQHLIAPRSSPERGASSGVSPLRKSSRHRPHHSSVALRKA
jgi:hypothetical protein